MATKTLGKNVISTDERKRRLRLKKLGRYGAIPSPLLHEAMLSEGPSSLAKKLASRTIGIEDISAAAQLWERPQAIIFARTLARATSDISLKKAAASAMASHPHGKEFVPILTYQENIEAAVLALVEHGDDAHVFEETSRLEREAVDTYMAGVLAESLMSVVSLCQGGRADLFHSVASSINTRLGKTRNN